MTGWCRRDSFIHKSIDADECLHGEGLAQNTHDLPAVRDRMRKYSVTKPTPQYSRSQTNKRAQASERKQEERKARSKKQWVAIRIAFLF